jgi:hypothetical protein
MNTVTLNSIRFVVIFLIQTLILNQVELGWGIQFMIYPLMIVLLPFEMTTIYVLLIAFGMGMAVDALSNTFGLHTSSALVVAILRPGVFKLFAPRDGYENLKEGSIPQMGIAWFIYVYGTLLIVHHLWFFILEIFRFEEISLVFTKTFLSLPLSLSVSILVQSFLVSKPKDR